MQLPAQANLKDHSNSTPPILIALVKDMLIKSTEAPQISQMALSLLKCGKCRTLLDDSAAQGKPWPHHVDM